MTNPLIGIISNKQYEKLSKLGLIAKTAERNYLIRKKYKKIKPKLRTEAAIYVIMGEYPYLQFDTLRKIVYRKFRF